MSRIQKAFENKKALIGYLVAGAPSLDKTKEYILAMQKGGADLVEISIPFSDPIAGGKDVQGANERALANGTTPEKIFDMVASMKNELTIPVVFYSYINPIFNYGYAEFFAKCRECGIDGVIIPDLPFKERGELLQMSIDNDVDIISMVVPMPGEKMMPIAKEARGFIYFAFPMGAVPVDQVSGMISDIKNISKTPVAISCGVETRQQADIYTQISDGVIIEDEVMKIIEEGGDNTSRLLTEYFEQMKA